jgi:hypothetical protein
MSAIQEERQKTKFIEVLERLRCSEQISKECLDCSLALTDKCKVLERSFKAVAPVIMIPKDENDN